MNAYQDIIGKSRPVSKHPKMAVENRAKIFAPFAALRGFEISILTKEQDRILVPKRLISDEMLEENEKILGRLQGGEHIRLCWFNPVKVIDEVAVGEYRTEPATVCGINPLSKELLLPEGSVPLDDIWEVSLDAE